ncbi:hypothetical protein B7494_g6129 [Chlorociboria aeruginascens]|nr:hypothetical protein B7494_g6129 [Chlorociboria aeruginascens]
MDSPITPTETRERWGKAEYVGKLTLTGDHLIDEAVLAFMPKGTKVISSERCGPSPWTRPMRVSVLLPDGTPKQYFLKIMDGDQGEAFTLGEYVSMATIKAVAPDLVPTPRGRGKFKSSETYFFLGDFIEMDPTVIPTPEQLTSRLVELHRSSPSPNGMFGFPVTTFDGPSSQLVGWEKSWAKFWSKLFRHVLDINNESCGVWPELEIVAKQLIDVVVPRLLGTLQSDGRQIQPVLIHGDLHLGNVAVPKDGGKVMFFDAGCFYAHNEMDLAGWTTKVHTTTRIGGYIESYKQKLAPSEPAEEFDDRNRLYNLKGHLNVASAWPDKAKDMRETLYNDILYLCEKYGPLPSDASKDLVPKARKPKFDLILKINELNNVPLVSGTCYIKWHLPSSIAAEHRGRTDKAPIKEHKVFFEYERTISVRLLIDKNNNLQECLINFEVVQDYSNGGRGEKITLGYITLNLAEYVEPSEAGGPDGEEGVTRRYLMQDSKINSTLKIGIAMKQVDGDRNYVAPPLKTAPVFGGIAGIMAGEGEQDEVGKDTNEAEFDHRHHEHERRRHHNRTPSASSGKSQSTVTDRKSNLRMSHKYSKSKDNIPNQSPMTPDSRIETSSEGSEAGRTGFRSVKELDEFDLREDLVAWSLPGTVAAKS